MRHGSLFSGIGGFELAAEWTGWTNVFHCEWNKFGQQVLKHHFPKSISYEDITKTDFTIHRGDIDVLTGGFPCQPYSMAGKRLGKADERHLWPEMLRVIRETSPSYVVGENVRGLVSWNGGLVFDEVQADLEALGYEVLPVLLPACAVGAPHRRDRVWFVAYCEDVRRIKSTKTGREWEKHEQARSPLWNTPNRNGSSNDATDTDQCATRPPGESGSLESNGSDGHILKDQRGAETELDNRLHEFSRNVTDTNSIRQHECKCEHEKHADQRGLNAQHDIEQNDAKHTKGIGQKHALEDRELERRRFRQPNERNTWDTFPLESPLCSGDDGISTELDGITFPKWRNESIKAYGNAIVPQVAYQIFKAIQQHVKSQKSQT